MRGFGRRLQLYPFLFGLLAVLLLIQIIRLIWLVATPLGPVGDWRASEVQVLSPQSRLALFSSFDPFFRAGPAQSGNVITSLQLTLYGIRMNAGSGLGSAILAGPDGVQENYIVGDEIGPGVTLASVQFDHVTIDRGGTAESLYLDQSVPAETVGTGEAETIDLGLMPMAPDPLVPVANDITREVAFQPRVAAGIMTGVLVSPQGNGALFKSAGFRDGDIITSVNGKPVSSIADIRALKNQIRPGARISVDVERGGDTIPISINLPGQ